MTLSQNSNANARWEVIWLNPRGARVKKAFNHDFGEALKTYVLLKSSGRKGVTLRCCNVGFPPPERITHHEVTSWEVVKRRGKRYKRKTVTYEDLMLTKYNPIGIWWCPYCIQLRRFKQTRDWTGRDHMECPMCGINERDWHVRRYNPQATVVEWRRRGRRRRSRRRVR